MVLCFVEAKRAATQVPYRIQLRSVPPVRIIGIVGVKLLHPLYRLGCIWKIGNRPIIVLKFVHVAVQLLQRHPPISKQFYFPIWVINDAFGVFIGGHNRFNACDGGGARNQLPVRLCRD